MLCLPYYCSQRSPKYKSGNWMSKLKNQSLSEMSIPGTHDSGCKVHLGFCQTQSYTIQYQLDAGVRFFDIRCNHNSNLFIIHHGIIYCGLSFQDVLEVINKFLGENPKEAIIMRIKEEYDSKNCTRTFQETFKEYYNAYESIFYIENGIPMLDNIRGKIWVIFDFEYNQGFNWGSADIEDEWVIEIFTELNQKVDAVRKHLDLAKVGDNNKLYITFCSASGVLCWPWNVAFYINPIPLQYSEKLGIVVMDFPGEDLIKHIIDQNKVDV